MTAQQRGKTAFHAGTATEDSVARLYARGGMPVLAQRWRGSASEIDLIVRNGDGVVFVEVKKAAVMRKRCSV